MNTCQRRQGGAALAVHFIEGEVSTFMSVGGKKFIYKGEWVHA